MYVGRRPPRKRDGDRTIFNSTVEELYDDNWEELIRTVNYTPNTSRWEIVTKETGESYFTKSDQMAKWAEEDDELEVRLMWWEEL